MNSCQLCNVTVMDYNSYPQHDFMCNDCERMGSAAELKTLQKALDKADLGKQFPVSPILLKVILRNHFKLVKENKKNETRVKTLKEVVANKDEEIMEALSERNEAQARLDELDQSKDEVRAAIKRLVKATLKEELAVPVTKRELLERLMEMEENE